jgi:hypothetical protein
VEVIQRSEFEADVRRAVVAAHRERRQAVDLSLQDAADVWFGDAIQLLKGFDQLGAGNTHP